MKNYFSFYSYIVRILLSVLAILSNHLYAKPIENQLNCTSDDIVAVHQASATLTNVVVVGDVTETNRISKIYEATDCAGVYLNGNDDKNGISDPNPNIGELGDGILNGQTLNDGTVIMTGMEFITNNDLQALSGDNLKDDPGWIHLAEYETYDDKDSTIDYSSIGPSTLSNSLLDIGDLLTLSLHCTLGDIDSGCTSLSWSIATVPSIIEQVQALLGPSTFDHLAFSVKAGDAFAVYDFNFTEIFSLESDVNFATPYIISGTLNTNDFSNENGGFNAISHMNVWARDPASVGIPEPSSLAIMGLSLFLLVSRRKWLPQ